MASRYFTNCLSNLSCSNNFSCDTSETENRPLVICLASPHTCCGARIKWYLIGVQKSSSLGRSYRTSPFTNKRSQLLRFWQRCERVANLSHFISRTLGPRMQSWIMTAANRKEDGFLECRRLSFVCNDRNKRRVPGSPWRVGMDRIGGRAA